MTRNLSCLIQKFGVIFFISFAICKLPTFYIFFFTVGLAWNLVSFLIECWLDLHGNLCFFIFNVDSIDKKKYDLSLREKNSQFFRIPFIPTFVPETQNLIFQAPWGVDSGRGCRRQHSSAFLDSDHLILQSERWRATISCHCDDLSHSI